MNCGGGDRERNRRLRRDPAALVTEPLTQQPQKRARRTRIETAGAVRREGGPCFLSKQR